MSMRIGSGFDLHRLKTGRTFVLGGIEISGPEGPYGHSDGDPLIHALADAMLGAAALGDIGDHFPDNDPEWSHCTGERILKLVHEKVKAAGFGIVNADSTVSLEKPPLKDRKRVIQRNLAGILGIEEDRICVKAKTAEGFGALGRGDCIAVQASVLLSDEK